MRLLEVGWLMPWVIAASRRLMGNVDGSEGIGFSRRPNLLEGVAIAVASWWITLRLVCLCRYDQTARDADFHVYRRKVRNFSRRSLR